MLPFRTDIGHVAAQLPEPLARVDHAGRIVWRNEAFRELTEGDGPTLLGRPLRDLAHPSERATVEAALTGIEGGASTASVHVRVRDTAGRWPAADVTLVATPPFEHRGGFVTALVRLGRR